MTIDTPIARSVNGVRMAEAVAAAINEGTFEPAFTVVRRRLIPVIKREKLDGLQVYCAAGKSERTRAAKGVVRAVQLVKVIIFAPLPPIDHDAEKAEAFDAELGRLDSLCTQIQNHLFEQKQIAIPGDRPQVTSVLDITQESPFSFDYAVSQHMFHTILDVRLAALESIKKSS